MEFLFALPLLILPFLLPLATGLMAKSFGRKFGFWFCISIPLPFIANVILLCLPDRSAQKAVKLKPVESEEVFDHLFVKRTGEFCRRAGMYDTGIIVRSVIPGQFIAALNSC